MRGCSWYKTANFFQSLSVIRRLRPSARRVRNRPASTWLSRTCWGMVADWVIMAIEGVVPSTRERSFSAGLGSGQASDEPILYGLRIQLRARVRSTW